MYAIVIAGLSCLKRATLTDANSANTQGGCRTPLTLQYSEERLLLYALAACVQQPAQCQLQDHKCSKSDHSL